MEKILVVISIIFFLFTNVGKMYAVENSSGSSAAFLKPAATNYPNNRVKILREFLKQYDSPLATHAYDFVKYAERYNLDWRLVAAISGVESTFGKAIPYNSYNGWGWGIYGNNMIRFSSWTEGIKTVSQGLRENYINKWETEDVYEIGRFYASSPTWASRVTYFMEQIEKYKNQKLAHNLSISL